VRRCLVVLAVALAACTPLACDGGGGDVATGDLVWDGKPRVVRQASLPRDRVLVGFVRNDSLRRVTIDAKDVYAVDADGKRLRGQATFIRSYIHPLFPPTRPPEGGLPDSERIRLGQVAQLEPGKRTHLTVAWRLRRGGKPAVRVEYGFGSLPIPGA
jgi:hypothetical protein